jgi:predicted PurR-regulated permease PerM
MRGLGILRLTQLFGPKVGQFFAEYGIYIFLIFILFIAIFILYSWFDMFKDLFKFFRRNTSGDSEEVEEEAPKFKKIIKLIIIVTLVFVVLFTVFSAYAYFSIDCEKIIQEFSEKTGEYSSLLLENINKRELSLALAYTNELIDNYENQIIFLNENEQCISNEFEVANLKDVNDTLIQLKAIQLQLIVNLNK